MSSIRADWVAGLLIGLLSACQIGKTQSLSNEKSTSIQIYQKWELQRGDLIHNQTVISALGDLAIEMDGKLVYAPVHGEVKPGSNGCVLFAGTELPGYLFQFCGISTPKLGTLRQGQPIGTANLLVFATFLKQPSGTWALLQ